MGEVFQLMKDLGIPIVWNLTLAVLFVLFVLIVWLCGMDPVVTATVPFVLCCLSGICGACGLLDRSQSHLDRVKSRALQKEVKASDSGQHKKAAVAEAPTCYGHKPRELFPDANTANYAALEEGVAGEGAMAWQCSENVPTDANLSGNDGAVLTQHEMSCTAPDEGARRPAERLDFYAQALNESYAVGVTADGYKTECNTTQGQPERVDFFEAVSESEADTTPVAMGEGPAPPLPPPAAPPTPSVFTVAGLETSNTRASQDPKWETPIREADTQPLLLSESSEARELAAQCTVEEDAKDGVGAKVAYTINCVNPCAVPLDAAAVDATDAVEGSEQEDEEYEECLSFRAVESTAGADEALAAQSPEAVASSALQQHLAAAACALQSGAPSVVSGAVEGDVSAMRVEQQTCKSELSPAAEPISQAGPTNASGELQKSILGAGTQPTPTAEPISFVGPITASLELQTSVLEAETTPFLSPAAPAASELTQQASPEPTASPPGTTDELKGHPVDEDGEDQQPTSQRVETELFDRTINGICEDHQPIGQRVETELFDRTINGICEDQQPTSQRVETELFDRTMNTIMKARQDEQAEAQCPGTECRAADAVDEVALDVQRLGKPGSPDRASRAELSASVSQSLAAAASAGSSVEASPPREAALDSLRQVEAVNAAAELSLPAEASEPSTPQVFRILIGADVGVLGCQILYQNDVMQETPDVHPLRPYIGIVSPTGGAAQHGVITGDRILAVNGEAVAGLKYDFFIRAIKERPVTLELERGDKAGM